MKLELYTATALQLTIAISRLQRFEIRGSSPGALPQAFTFRAFGAEDPSSQQAFDGKAFKRRLTELVGPSR
jgi:hypothetical protein